MEIFFVVCAVLFGIVFGVLIFFFVLPLIPTVIERLTNRPNRDRHDATVANYGVSEFGFFTGLAPRQVKIVQAGDTFVRCIMDYTGHTFKGLVEPMILSNSEEYWEVVSTTEGDYIGKPDAHPISKSLMGIPALDSLLYVWGMWVYKATGYVFIGIYPFRKIRTYRLDRYKKDQRSGEMTRTEDYSDHYRVADFSFPVVVPEADTSDKVPVSVSTDNILRVYNPFMAAYGTNDWAERITSAVRDKVTGYTRHHPLDSVLSAKSGRDENDLAKKIFAIGQEGLDAHDTIYTFGLEMVQVLVTDISVVEASTPAKQQLAGLALARVDSAAKAERAKGDAAQLREQIAVVREGGHIGLAVLASERDVRTAAAAGERAIIVLGGGSSSTDPLQAAMLQEIRDVNFRNQLSGKKD